MKPAVIGAIDAQHDVDAGHTLAGPALARVQAVCNFVNAETARQRNILIGIAIASVVGAILMPVITGVYDARILFVLVLGVIGFFFARARHELSSVYAGVAVKRMIAAVSKGLSYRSGSSLTREQFLASDLYGGVAKCSIRDEILGRVRDTKYSIHRVRAVAADHRTAVFDGVVMRIDGAFPGHTLVVADGDRHPQGERVRRDIVLLKSPAFEERFSVFATDYHAARRIVTAQRMAVILDAAEHVGGELRLAFTPKGVYVGVPGGDALRVTASLFGGHLTPEIAVGRLTSVVTFAERLARALGE